MIKWKTAFVSHMNWIMTMKKYVICFFVASFAVLLSFADSEVVGDRTWSFYVSDADGTAIVNGVSPSDGDLIIPPVLGGMSVKRIEARRYWNNNYYYYGYDSYFKNATSVTIPSSVTNIGHYAFYNCVGLTSVSIPFGVKCIGDYAFCNCSRLTSFTIPSGVTDVGSYAFSGCGELTSLTIPLGVASIGEAAFSGCNAIKNVTVPGWKCGVDFSSVTNLIIAGGTTIISTNAFSSCSCLLSVEIPDSVTSIGDWSFARCSSLTAVTIPNSVTNVGSYAFGGCSGLTSVTIPNSVTSIGYSAFGGCSGLTSVEILSSVISVAYNAFDGCYAVRDLVAPGGRYNGMGSVTNLVVTEGTTRVWGASSCSELMSVKFPSSVTTIDHRAFSGCSGLTSIEIPANVTSIGYMSFSGCSGLTAVTIPPSVTNIGELAFSNCSGLTSVTILSSEASIGNNAFSGCNAIRNVVTSGIKSNIDLSSVTNLVIAEGTTIIGDYSCSGCREITSLTIPNGVTHIGVSAFSDCSELVSVTIPPSVTHVAANAFAGCERIRRVDVHSINEWLGVCFENAEANPLYMGAVLYEGGEEVGSIVIPDEISDIGDYAFYGGRFASVTICGNKTRISQTSFAGCSNITNLALSGELCYQNPDALNMQGWSMSEDGMFHAGRNNTLKLAIKGPLRFSFKWKATWSGRFLSLSVDEQQTAQCSSESWREVAVEIPEGVHELKWIHSSPGSYAGCEAWVDLTDFWNADWWQKRWPVVEGLFPDSFANITSLAITDGSGCINPRFCEGCSSLESVTIPAGVTNVGANAFAGCGNIRRVDIPSIADWMGMHFENAEANPLNAGAALYVNGEEVTNLVIPDGTTEIGEYAFYAGQFTSVVLPNSVTNVGEYAFYAGQFMSAVLPSSLTNVATTAFRGCSNIVDVIIGGMPRLEQLVPISNWTQQPDGSWLPSLSSNMEIMISGPRQIVFKWTLANRAGRSSYGCLRCYVDGALQAEWRNDAWETVTVDVPSGKHEIIWSFSRDRENSCWSYIKLESGFGSGMEVLFPDSYMKIKRISILPSVKAISDFFFAGCVGLTRVDIPSIGDWLNIDFANAAVSPLFSGAKLYVDGAEVTELVIPDGTTAIGDYAFANVQFTSVTIPASVTNVAVTAFTGCTNIVDLVVPSWLNVASTFPNSKDKIAHVTLVPSGNVPALAYDGCTAIERVDVASMEEWLALRFANETANPLHNGAAFYVGGEEVTELVIPEETTEIGEYAFAGGRFASVLIPDSVTNVGDSAFYNCSNLASLTIGDSVTSIGASVFSNCSGLRDVVVSQYVCANRMSSVFPQSYQSITNVLISDGVTCIGDFAFSGCSGLMSVTIPDSVTSIGSCAFSGCSGLADVNGFVIFLNVLYEYYGDDENVIIPDGVTSIGDSAFSNCSGLTSVTIPDSVTSIGGSAFSGCRRLASVMVPDSVTSIGDSAFSNCSGLTSVTIPDGVTSIGDSAFANCSGLTSVTIPDSVTSIGDSAFSGCRGLASVTVPDSVTSIGPFAFNECSELRDVAVPQCVCTNRLSSVFPSSYQSITNVVISDGVTSIGDGAFSGCSGLTSVTVPVGVTSIGYRAFYYCSGLTSVTIPGSVTDIGEGAFSGCSGLRDVAVPQCVCTNSILSVFPSSYQLITNVVIADGVMSIGSYAFYGCSGLTSVTVPVGVTSIGYRAFYYCSGLTSVTIPGSVTDIGEEAFSGCSGLRDVAVPQCVCVNHMSSVFSSSYQSITNIVISGNVTSIGNEAFNNCGSLMSITIPSGVTNIGYRAFSGCSGITSVTIPDSVMCIGDYAFSRCSGLTSVTISDSVTSIGDYAFYYCSGITSVTIPNSVMSIGSSVFSGCSGLMGVTIPKSVTSIDERAFYGCSRISGVMIPDSVTSIGDWAFGDCSGLTSVEMPDSVTRIGSYAFYGCSGLTSVTIPDSVTSIGNSVFADCSELRDITVPQCVFTEQSIITVLSSSYQSITNVVISDSVTSIGNSAFAGWSWLTSVTISDSVTSIGELAFYNCSNLASLRIGDGVTSIGSGSFSGCSGLKELWVPKDFVINYSSVFGNNGRPAEMEVIYYDKFSNRKNELLTAGDGMSANIVMTATNDCRVTFAWKCSCEPMRKGRMFDYLSFCVDGVQRDAICGETGWTNMTFVVSGPGEHVLRWTYQKDESDSEGEDCGWVRNVRVVPFAMLSFLAGETPAGAPPDALSFYADAGTVRLPGSGTLAWPKHTFIGWSDGNAVFSAGSAYHCDADVTELTATWARNELAAPVIDVPEVFYDDTATVTIFAAAGAEVRYTLDGAAPNAGSTLYTSPFVIGATTTIRAVAMRDDYFDSQESSLTAVRDFMTFGEAVNAPGLIFTPSDGTGWRRVGNESPDGCALRSGEIGHNATSRLETVVSGEGFITFSCRVEGEVFKSAVYDGLAFCIDGVQQGELMGNENWTTNTFEVVGTGTHTLSWLYVKDGEGDGEGEDCAWVDKVIWTPSGGGGGDTTESSVFTVIFNANGGKGGTIVTQDYGTSLIAPTVTRTGYTFIGWSPAVPATMPAGNQTYTAQWKVNQYTAMFNANGGSGGTKKTQNYGTSLTAPTVTRTGYAFVGWSPSVPATMPAESLTYTAQWRVNQYTVTFNANGGAGGTSVTQDYGTSLTAPTVTRTGYTFTGWSPAVPATVPAGNITYTAQWRINRYSVSLNLNGGVGAGSITVDYGTLVGDIPVPTRQWNAFAGWFTAAEGGERVDGATAITGPIELYAQWTRTHYVVNFNANGGKSSEASRPVPVSSAIGDLPIATRSGHAFAGWWTEAGGGSQVTSVYCVMNDQTFYAHWISEAVILVNADESYETEADGSFALKLGELVVSASTPKITVKGLPTGLKFDAKTGLVSGKATKPGVYKVTVSATNATVKKPVTATFEIVVPNLRSEVLSGLKPETDAYGVVMCGVNLDDGLIDCTPEDGWTLKVAGLPVGLRYDAKTGKITGVPTKAGTFTVTFTATKGKEKETATITLKTEALPTWATGTFTGSVKCRVESGELEEEVGLATMTVAANGKVSGKVSLDGTNWTFSAASYAAVRRAGDSAPYQDGEHFVVEAVAKAGKAERAIELEVAACDGGFIETALPNAVVDGTFGEGEVKMWRNMWKDKETAVAAKATIAEFEGVYTVSVANGADYGSGYMSLTVGKNGDVKASGKLSDGTSVSATSPLMYDEDAGWFALLYAAPSAYKGGSFAAAVGFAAAVAGRPPYQLSPVIFAPQWTSRNPQATGEYGAGFVREVDLVGAYYNKLDTLRKYYESVRVGFGGAPDLGYTYKETSLNEKGKKVTTSSASTAEAVDTLSQPGLTATVNEKGAIVVAKATKPVQDKATKEWYYNGANDGALALSFAQATGIFKGSYTFWYDYLSAYDDTNGKETLAHVSKKVSFEGIMVQGEESMRGFYLWDAAGEYVDEKTGKPKAYKYKQSFPVLLLVE